MAEHTERLPRIFQANLDRLFQRVIQPALTSLNTHPVLERGEAKSLDQFLDRAEAQVDNYIANEAAKAFTLTLDATFERQLSIWITASTIEAVSGNTKRNGFAKHLELCADRAGIHLG